MNHVQFTLGTSNKAKAEAWATAISQATGVKKDTVFRLIYLGSQTFIATKAQFGSFIVERYKFYPEVSGVNATVDIDPKFVSEFSIPKAFSLDGSAEVYFECVDNRHRHTFRNKFGLRLMEGFHSCSYVSFGRIIAHMPPGFKNTIKVVDWETISNSIYDLTKNLTTT